MPARSLLTKKEEKLFHYIKRGNYDKFTQLISSKPNFNILCIIKKHGNTLLHYCCKYNSSPILLYLLKRVNMIDIKNENGKTPLQIATKYKNGELCNILLSKGADFRLINNNNKCALDYGLESLVDLSHYLPKESYMNNILNIYDNRNEEYNGIIYDSEEEEEENSDWYFEENYEDYNISKDKNEYKRKIYNDWEEEMRRREKEKLEEKQLKENKYKNQEIKSNDEKMNIYKNIEKNNEMRWLKFINSNPKYLKTNDIPFPRGLSSDENNILGLNKEMSKNEIKKIINENQRRWHPDKFERRFNNLLNEENKEEIMRRVKEISQTINKLKNDYL